MWLFTHYNVFPVKRVERLYFHTGGGLLLVLRPQSSACWYGIHSRSTNLLHDCTVTLFKPHHNSHIAWRLCKLFCTPPFTLLIVLINSIYYNSIIIMQWLVCWFKDQGKKGVCTGKNCGSVAFWLLFAIQYKLVLLANCDTTYTDTLFSVLKKKFVMQTFQWSSVETSWPTWSLRRRCGVESQDSLISFKTFIVRASWIV